MNLSDWLSNQQIKTIHRYIDTMTRNQILHTLRNILPPAGRTRREYTEQVNLGQFRRNMIQYFTTQFREVIFPHVFPDGIPTEFEPTSQIRQKIFYAGMYTTVRQMFLTKVLLTLYKKIHTNWDAEHPSTHINAPMMAGGFKQFTSKEY